MYLRKSMSVYKKKKIGYLFSIQKLFRSNMKDMYNQNQVVKLRLASLKIIIIIKVQKNKVLELESSCFPIAKTDF